MARISKRGRKAKPQTRRKALAPKKTVAPAKSGDATLKHQLAEAFEQQAATAEILNVISNSPTDTQPVFDAIVQSGLKLFPGALVSVALRYGDRITPRPSPRRILLASKRGGAQFPVPPSRGITCTAQPCLIAGSWIFPTWRIPRRNLSPGAKTS